MKRKFEFKSYMDNNLVTHIRNYGELNIVNKKVVIELDAYKFIIEKDKVIVTYLEPLKNEFIFDLNSIISINYHTLYGDILFDVKTSFMEFKNSNLLLEYSLSQNGEKQADYKIILNNI